MGLFSFRKKPKPKGFDKNPFSYSAPEGSPKQMPPLKNLDDVESSQPKNSEEKKDEFAVPDFSDDILSAPKPPEEETIEPEGPNYIEPQAEPVQEQIETEPVEVVQDETEVLEPIIEETDSSEATPQSLWADEQAQAAEEAAVEPVEAATPKNIVIKTEDSLDIYVEKDQYEDVLLKVASIETDVKKAAQHIGRFADNEAIITSKLDEWKKLLLVIQEKLMQVDAQIFEKGEIHG